MQETVVFGGSFNPVHIGHLALADEARCFVQAKRVLFLPSFQTPLKEAPAVSGRQRLAMLQIALQGVGWAEISDFEIAQNRPCYAIESLRALQKEGLLPPKPYFFIGQDWFSRFSQWKESAALAQEARLLTARRAGLADEFNFPHTALANDLFELSSSQIRNRIAEGRPFRFLVPQGVYEYIKRHRLYS